MNTRLIVVFVTLMNTRAAVGQTQSVPADHPAPCRAEVTSSDGIGVNTYSYDMFGRLELLEMDYDGNGVSNETVTYHYDRGTTLLSYSTDTDVDGWPDSFFEYEYFDYDGNGGSVPATCFTPSYMGTGCPSGGLYAADISRARSGYGFYIDVSFFYDAEGHLVRTSYTPSDTRNEAERRTYAYNEDHRLREEQNGTVSNEGWDRNVFTLRTTIEYEYNEAGALVRRRLDGDSDGSIDVEMTYEYDCWAGSEGIVTGIEGPVPVSIGASCSVTITPHLGTYNCRLVVECDEQIIYGEDIAGYNDCRETDTGAVEVNDYGTTSENGDPALRLTRDYLTISDESAPGMGSWTVSIQFGSTMGQAVFESVLADDQLVECPSHGLCGNASCFCDSNGYLVVREGYQYENVLESGTFRTTYTYYDSGHVETVENIALEPTDGYYGLQAGWRSTYSYDQHGNLLIEEQAFNSDDWYSTQRITFDEQGNRLTEEEHTEDSRYGGVLERHTLTTYTHDEHGRVLTREVDDYVDGTLDWHYAYTYDEVGNRLTEETENRRCMWDPPCEVDHTEGDYVGSCLEDGVCFDLEVSEESWRDQSSIGVLLPIENVTVSSFISGEYLGYDFGPRNLFDEDLSSCWQVHEGVGSSFRISFVGRVNLNAIEIANGFQHVDDDLGDLFMLNSRIASAELTFSDGSRVEATLDPSERGYGRVSFDARAVDWVEVETTRVQPGSRWSDLAVSEVRAIGVLP